MKDPHRERCQDRDPVLAHVHRLGLFHRAIGVGAHALVLQFVGEGDFLVRYRVLGVEADHHRDVIVAAPVRVVLVGEGILIYEAGVIVAIEEAEEEGGVFLEEMIQIRADAWVVSI